MPDVGTATSRSPRAGRAISARVAAMVDAAVVARDRNLRAVGDQRDEFVDGIVEHRPIVAIVGTRTAWHDGGADLGDGS